MTRQILLISVLLFSCKPVTAPMTESVVKTDETRASLQQACDQFLPEDARDELIDATCACVAERPGLQHLHQSLCTETDLKRYYRNVRMTLTRESLESFTGTDGTPPSAEDRECARNLADFYVETSLDFIRSDCESDSDADLLSLLTLPESSAPEKCWTLTRMTPDACILARPCAGSGPSDPSALPLTADSQAAIAGMVAEGETVTLCRTSLREIHMLKDPSNVNINYNYSFANMLTHGRTAAQQTFGPANCHGTAQAMMGGFLDRFTATEITYHSTVVEQECEAKAKALFAAAAQKSGQEFPTARHLPVERGGYLINMVHDEGCDPNSCGTVSFHVNACEGDPLAHVFFSGMCIHCWDQTLQSAGLQRLGPEATWQDLVPGCILTASDHSVTMLYESNGLCFYYEATSPFGPPQLRVNTCNMFYHRFPKRWCPTSPLLFDGRR